MQVSECRKIKVWHQSMTAANGVHLILSVSRDGRQALNFLSFLGCKLAVAGWKVEDAAPICNYCCLSVAKRKPPVLSAARCVLRVFCGP